MSEKKERVWNESWQRWEDEYTLYCDNCDCEINDTYYKVDNEILCKDCLLEKIKEELMEDFKNPVEIFYEEDIKKSKNFYEYIINLAKNDNSLAESLMNDIINDDNYSLWNYLIVDICDIEYFKCRIIENLSTNDDYWLVDTYLKYNKDIEEIID